MLTSQRELLGLASAAARGMGYPYGIGDDLARAVVWLVVRDADGLGALLASTPRVGRIPAVDPGPVDGVHVGSDGLGLLDLLIADHLVADHLVADTDASGQPMSLQLRRLDSPLLLVGLVAVAAGAADLTLDLVIGEGDPMPLTGTTHAAQINRFDLEAMGESVGIFCRAAESSGDGPPLQRTRLAVPDDRWAQAEGLAARTYVPASERSRHHGAGAGLTDND